MPAVKNNMTLNRVLRELAKELVNPEDGDNVHHGSAKRVAWRCGEGHVWEVSVNNRTQKGSGCPYCANKKVFVGFNDLWTTEPEICQELLDPKDGYKYTRRSGVKLDWKCSLGHVWAARMGTRKSGSGCSICTNRKVLAGFNDLKTTDPTLFLELTDSTLLITRGHGKKVSWTCSANHQWEATPNNRTNSGRGCPYCDKYQTSRSEIALRELLREVGYDVNTDHTFRLQVSGWHRKSVQVDIYFEYFGLKFVVEYDGAYWHLDRRGMDLMKTKMLLDNGYHVARISAQSSHTIDALAIEDPRFLPLETTYDRGDPTALLSAVEQIQVWITALTAL
jgi:hypothetical protein